MKNLTHVHSSKLKMKKQKLRLHAQLDTVTACWLAESPLIKKQSVLWNMIGFSSYLQVTYLEIVGYLWVLHEHECQTHAGYVYFKSL